jgi:uncharacterized protein
VVLIAVFYAGGGWYFANLLDERGLAGESRRAAFLDVTLDLEIVVIEPNPDVDDAYVLTLARTDSDGREPVLVDGIWGLRWEGNGYGQVGGVIASDADSVTRPLLVLRGEPPTPGLSAGLDARAYPDDPRTTGVRVHDELIETDLGLFPAWFAPAAPDEGNAGTWAIVVHGNSMSRTDGYRMLPILREAGVPSLTITYRNDPGAPEDPSRRLHYGLTEWPDLEAAVAYALDAGARDVVLLGYSMGGSVIMAFLQRSELAGRVRAVVLDAPMLDFSATVDDNASRETLPLVDVPLPPSLTAVAKWIADRRWDLRWGELDYLSDTERYGELPFLVFHGEEDTTVPIATSERFAELLPDTVTLIRCADAEHIECWNVGPETYRRELVGFLQETGAT